MKSDQPTTAENRAKFFGMARELAREKGLRWSEACLEIKKRYPEAREAFGAPRDMRRQPVEPA